MSHTLRRATPALLSPARPWRHPINYPSPRLSSLPCRPVLLAHSPCFLGSLADKLPAAQSLPRGFLRNNRNVVPHLRPVLSSPGHASLSEIVGVRNHTAYSSDHPTFQWRNNGSSSWDLPGRWHTCWEPNRRPVHPTPGDALEDSVSWVQLYVSSDKHYGRRPAPPTKGKNCMYTQSSGVGGGDPLQSQASVPANYFSLINMFNK